MNLRGFLHQLVLLALITGILSPAGRSPGAASASEPALVRIDLRTPSDLSALLDLQLPILARLRDAVGRQYALVQVEAKRLSEMNAAGLHTRTLDTSASLQAYFLVSTYRGVDLERLRSEIDNSARVRLLHDDGLRLVVRGDPGEVEALVAPLGELVYLMPHTGIMTEVDAERSPDVIAPDPVVEEMLAQVSTSGLSAYNGGLSGEWPVSISGSEYTIATRYTYAEESIAQATQYAYENFQSFGLASYFHAYTLPGGGSRRNVIAEQTGLTQPERIFLLGAHLDSTATRNGDDPFTYAPGADDNASGSAGVLTAAEILSQYTFGCTLRYALFTGEEQGLYGSLAYAASTASSGDDIEAVINLDMIAHNSDAAPVFELHTREQGNNSADLPIANLFSDVIAVYNLDLQPEIVASGITASDHYAFWQEGYPAILAIEDMDDFTPYYHSSSDRLDTLDLNFYKNIVQAAVAAMAHLGCGVYDPGALEGVVSSASAGVPLPGARVEAMSTSGLDTSAESGNDGIYQLQLGAGGYTVTANLAGYLPSEVFEVDISPAMTTTLDIALQPCSPPQNLDFTYTSQPTYLGESTVFSATLQESGTTPVAFAWEFGDGALGAGETVTHTYPLSGIYNALLTASNCGGQITTQHPVTVSLRENLIYLPLAPSGAGAFLRSSAAE